MSQQTRSTLPVNNRLLAPAPKNTEQVAAQLQKKRLIQKQYYDASKSPTTASGRRTGHQTTKGHDHLGVVKEVCKEPRSYSIQSDGDIYRRNRRHILPVVEPPQVNTAGSDRQSADTAQLDTTPSTLQTPRLPQVIIQHSTNEQQTPAATVALLPM